MKQKQTMTAKLNDLRKKAVRKISRELWKRIVPESLLEISQEMNTQNNRSTAHPLFVIQVDKKQYGAEGWCDEAERKEDYDHEDFCESCAQLAEDNDEALPDYCENCAPEMFVWYKWEKAFDLQAGVFFTAKACDEHIRCNDYHYSNPRSYAISAWRNYEMQDTMKFLKNLTK